MAILPVEFTDDFMRDAVALVESGITQKTMCKDLGKLTPVEFETIMMGGVALAA